MEEVLHEILPVFEHMEGHKPIFSWSAKECEVAELNQFGMWLGV